METLLRFGRKIIPTKIFKLAQPYYHRLLAFVAALIYHFPSRKITVVGITGTKGKTTTVEILNALLEAGGKKTAIISTLRFKVGDISERNMLKMTMPGRFQVQKYIRHAVREKCDFVIIEMTSQGVLQYRHKHIELDALLFTNLSPEHIESHGSYEGYRDAKLELARILESSSKKHTTIVVNSDDLEGHHFLEIDADEKIPYSIEDLVPYEVKRRGLSFTFENISMESPLSGRFNLYNIVAALTYTKRQGVPLATCKKVLGHFSGVRGRVEFIEEGQDFDVVVDYAHTIDSLTKFYEVFQGSQSICILGNTGGGRDKWKRGKMAEVAEQFCEHIILTNEDPYDEDPRAIVDQMAQALTTSNYEIIMDRREAIRKALGVATTGDSVLITGKGTDPYIMGAHGTKIPWDDATVAREELKRLLNNKNN
jgi:UDP-N-acetylmuramoyl-L-alanyl-D-glutamate--2,6-diaminopimelate ligase